MRTAVKQGRRRAHRPAAGLFDELIVDNFAGGGGASLGIERAAGRAVDLAVNHDRAAIEMHTANHPHTRHFCEDVWKVKPREATGGRPVGLAWFSPDCKHFSRAKGAKPVEKKIRGLAWVAVKWAKAVRPRVIILENVREFEDWGPLVHLIIDGKPQLTRNGDPVMVPDKGRKGLTFKRFVGSFRSLGYHVEWRNLNAADYGAPTHRRRLFLIARCDGKPIRWPAHTHGKGRKPYRTAAECIDWSLPCPSIFDRKKPLAEKTMRRIAMGIKRYVLENPKPFIVPLTHKGERRTHGMDEPMPTVTGANRGELGLVAPYLVRPGHSGEEFRGQTLERPLGTQHACNEFALTTPYLVEVQNGSSINGTRAADRPAHTITANPKGGGVALVSAFLAKHFGGVVGHGIDRPASTVTAVDHHALAVAHLSKFYGTSTGSDPREPAPTVTGQGLHIAEVRAFLLKYYGTDQDPRLDEPLHTLTSKDRFGLVTVEGVDYQIVDIGMRMLTPRELARAQGFPDDYILTGTKTNQVARIGNSVCPVMSEVLVRANLMEAL
jgi:DNA (cytosine-5)-methyltransferase 1